MGCSNIYAAESFRALLQHNFERHYGTNRAPLSLSFDPSWLISNKDFDTTLADWMNHILTTYTDVYFVTELQVIQWIQNPTPVQSLRDLLSGRTPSVTSRDSLSAPGLTL